MRLFLAAPLTEEARHVLSRGIREAVPHGLPGRVVRPENWHLTLRFLGDVDELAVDRLLANLDEAELGDPLSIRWGGLGAFPRASRATVLWLGVERGSEELTRLAGLAEAAVVSAGFDSEDRPFRAHLTLSRIRPPRDVSDLIGQVRPFGLVMPVDRIVLYRSHLGRGGARYEELEGFRLG